MMLSLALIALYCLHLLHRVEAAPMSGQEPSSSTSFSGHRQESQLSREQDMENQLTGHFPEMAHLPDMEFADPKRVLKYLKTRGKWFHGDKFHFVDHWPEVYAAE